MSTAVILALSLLKNDIFAWRERSERNANVVPLHPICVACYKY